MSELIIIKDFELFNTVVKSALKIVESAKFQVSDAGLEIYGCKGTSVRCELTTNSILSKNPIVFCIQDLNMFAKVLSTVISVHENDFSDLKFELTSNAIKFSSKKLKTKFNLIDEDTISKWVSLAIKASMTSVFDFTTSSDLIKRVISHSYICGDNVKDLRVYLETKDDMEKNSVFATLGNHENDLNNEMTLKLGLVTYGSIPSERKPLTIDLERLIAFNSISSQDIKISLMNMNVLVCKTRLAGKDDSWFNMNTYCSLLKA